MKAVRPELVEVPFMVRQADKTTGHSTKLAKVASQVAGYHHERPLGPASV